MCVYLPGITSWEMDDKRGKGLCFFFPERYHKYRKFSRPQVCTLWECNEEEILDVEEVVIGAAEAEEEQAQIATILVHTVQKERNDTT